MNATEDAPTSCPVCGSQAKQYKTTSGGERHKRTYCPVCAWGMVIPV